MTRHARNSTAGAVYTYHERKKDTHQSGYGSKDVRLGKDSIKEFDCCCLTLQPCRNPVVTPEGYLYDKEAILEFYIHQKNDYKRKVKEYEKQKNKLDEEQKELARAEQQSKLDKFMQKESTIVSKFLDPFAKKETVAGSSKESVSNVVNGKDKELPSFWIPSLTPDAKPTLLKKPSDVVTDPMSGNPLKIKKLIDVNFTPIKDDDKKSLITKDARYVCAVTNDVLSNSVPCAVIKPSGCVVTMDCVEKLIKKDMLDPINSQKLKETDIIPLQRGASGFSASGIDLKAKVDGPAMMS